MYMLSAGWVKDFIDLARKSLLRCWRKGLLCASHDFLKRIVSKARPGQNDLSSRRVRRVDHVRDLPKQHRAGCFHYNHFRVLLCEQTP
jgi:hypothetical protein